MEMTKEESVCDLVDEDGYQSDTGRCWNGIGEYCDDDDGVKDDIEELSDDPLSSSSSTSSVGACLSLVYGVRNHLLVVLTPLVLSPIILCVDESHQNEARCGFVIAFMAIFWISEVIPIAITGLLPAILLPMLGIMTARQTSAAYFNDTSMLFLGGLLVAIAMELWNVHKRIAFLTVRIIGTEPKRLLLALSLVTWFLSIWISNTATTAMMMTITSVLLDQYKEAYRQRDDHNYTKLDPQHSNRQSKSSPSCSRADEEYERLCKAVNLTVAYSANIGGLGSIAGMGPNLVLYSAAQEMYESKGLKSPVTFTTWMAFCAPMSLLIVLVQWLWMVTYFLRCRGAQSCFCSCCKGHDGDSDVIDTDKAKAMIKEEYIKLGPVSYAEKTIFVVFFLMVLCWMSRDLGGIGGWGNLYPPRSVSDSTPSVVFGVLMFILPCTSPLRHSKGRKKGKFIDLKPLLRWSDVQEKMPWSLYLIMGGGYALAKAATTSGFSVWLGQQLMVLKALDIWLVLTILCYVVAFTTEIMSNTATATLMMPLLSEMALNLGVNPLFFMLPAANACAFAFMLPAATPPNTLVFSNKSVRVLDMVKCGFFLNIVSIPILIMATATWGNAIFHFDVIAPEFVRNNNTALFSTVNGSQVI